jgi:hypothetical protein
VRRNFEPLVKVKNLSWKWITRNGDSATGQAGEKVTFKGLGCGSCPFRQWSSRSKKKFEVFMLITFWRYIYIIFQRWKVIKKSENSRNQCFSYYFCLMIERSGCGSGRPKNIWILRIRIRNTAFKMILWDNFCWPLMTWICMVESEEKVAPVLLTSFLPYKKVVETKGWQ